MPAIMYNNVLYGNGSGGGGGGASALFQLTDVNILSPSDGQILKYNSASEKWENVDNILPMWRVLYYDQNNNFLNREYVRDGDDALYSYGTNEWARTSGGTADPTARDNISADLSLYYSQSHMAPTVEYKFVGDKEYTPYSHTFTAEEAGNYFVFVDASTKDSDATYATITSTGTEKYKEHFQYNSTSITVGVYYCNVGDTITMEMKKTSTFYDSYHIFSASVIKMNASFNSISKESAEAHENSTSRASASASGSKFGFAQCSYQSGTTHSVNCTDTTDGKKVEDDASSTNRGMNLIAINSQYESGQTLSLSASTSGSGYNNNFAIILALS